VFDTAGRLVTVLGGGLHEGGGRSLDWDGTDSSGRPVASGVYLYFVEAPEYSGLGKVVLVR
jgi:hypothetical protein